MKKWSLDMDLLGACNLKIKNKAQFFSSLDRGN